MAVAIICGAVSCAKEDISSSLAGEEVTVTFTANLPDLGTRAYGDAEYIDILYYNVYQHEGDDVLGISGYCDKLVDGKFFVNIEMIKGMTYDIVFWAQNKECGYYTLNDDKTVIANYDKKNANDDTRDAFFAFVSDFKPTDTADTRVVTLKRPFAQLNVATSDLDTVIKSGVEITSTTVEVQTYTVFNIKNGNVVGDPSTVTFTATAAPFSNNKSLKENYAYLSMNYLLVPKGDKGMLVDATYTFNNNKEGLNFNPSYTNIPLKQNYRTNILGKLLTQTADFEVVLEKEFYQPDTELTKYLVDGVHYEDFRAAVDAALASESKTVNFINDCTLEADETITVPEGNTLILNLNGNTLSCTTEDADKNDDGMITSADNEVVFDVRGTMTIKDGTVTLQHVGADYQNFGWNACGEICYVGFNGVLNVENAHLEHLGGVAMAYTIDLVNAASETRAFTDSESGVLLNVNNSTLNSAYVAVRVFNNGSGMNNVNIVNSNLFGASRAFWVHVFTNTDNGGKGEKVETLNLNIFNTGNPDTDNTFNSNNPGERLIEFGFADNEFFQVDTNGIRKNDTTLFWDGTKLVATSAELVAALQTAVAAGETNIVFDAKGANIGNFNKDDNTWFTTNLVPTGVTVTLRNATVSGISRWNNANGTLIFENCTFTNNSAYSINFAWGNGHVKFTKCELYGWCSFDGVTVEMNDCNIAGNGRYALVRSKKTFTMNNCTIDGSNAIKDDDYPDGVSIVNGAVLTMTGCTMTDAEYEYGQSLIDGNEVVDYGENSSYIIVDGKRLVCNPASLEYALKNGNAILMENNITVEAHLTKTSHGTNINIDGGGNELTLRGIYGVSGANVSLSNMTLVDSKTDDYTIFNQGGKIELNNVTYNSTINMAFQMAGGGDVVLTDCNISGDVTGDYAASNIWCGDGRNVTVNGGTYGSIFMNAQYHSGWPAASAHAASKITLNDGTITKLTLERELGAEGYYVSATLTQNGGTITNLVENPQNLDLTGRSQYNK